MIQFTCKGVKQINNRISFKHLYHSYLSAFFISVGVQNREFPEILIAKCRSKFYCTWFFCWGISCGSKRCVLEINVSRAWDPVNAGDKALTWETPTKRGRVNRYGSSKKQTSSSTVKSKDWLAWSPDNAYEWSNMSTHKLLIQWASTINIQLTVFIQ